MSRVLHFRVDGLTRLPIFAGLATAVVAFGMVALERSAGAATVVSAVTIDLVVVVPALYYLLVVRGLQLPAITVLPVFRLSLATASVVLPAGDRELYDMLAYLARPAELGIASYVLYRIHLGWRAFRAADTSDVLSRYQLGVRAALPPGVPSIDRAADAIAFEAALVSFATRPWRKPESPAGAVPFPGHRGAAYGGVVVALLIVLAAELAVVHLLLSLWSTTVAWVVTGLTIYGAVWIVGDYQAVRLRPSWVDADSACLRLGLRWSVVVSRHAVRNVRKAATGESVDGALQLALPYASRVLIELERPATAVGAYGIRRTVTAVELGVDDPDGFLRQFR